MSDANVEIVRAMCESHCSGDYPGALDLLDPEVEWHDAGDVVVASWHEVGGGKESGAAVEASATAEVRLRSAG